MSWNSPARGDVLQVHFEWQEDLPLHARQNREVFARFGVALYFAQCLEQQIGLMLSTMYNRNLMLASPEERDTILDEVLSKTLGQMEKDLKSKNVLPSTLEPRLREAVKLRNWLAHRYFYDRAVEMLTKHGREHMIVELQRKADFLKELDEEFTCIQKQWRRKMGISDEHMQFEMQKLLYAGSTP